jgi:hypothetical protein
MNYAGLQTEVANYLHRNDLTSQIPTFISIAESMIFRELSVDDMEVSVTGTTSGGYAALPADFDRVTRVSVTYGGSALALDYLNPADVSTTSTAYPKFYTIENNQLKIIQSGDVSYTLYYIPKIAPLSVSNATNWLLENAQDLYLYASSLEGAKYIRSAEQTASLSALVVTLLDSIRRQSARRSLPSGSMRIRANRG